MIGVLVQRLPRLDAGLRVCYVPRQCTKVGAFRLNRVGLAVGVSLVVVVSLVVGVHQAVADPTAALRRNGSVAGMHHRD